MKLIRPSFEILSTIDRREILKAIETAGRTCYKSEDKITDKSASKFVDMIKKRDHVSVLEHQSMTVKFICDRGVSHELVRHRISSFSQESTRYCNYSKDRFGNQLTFIIPVWFCESMKEDLENGLIDNHSCNFKTPESNFLRSLEGCEENYFALLEQGWTPQMARSILPNALKTEVVMTANMRQWAEVFRQRCSEAAHPQMQEIMIPLRDIMVNILPEIFKD